MNHNLQDQIVVGIHPGANWPNKRWPPDYMAILSEKLQEDGFKTVFFGGKSDIEIVEKVVAQCKVKPVVFTGILSLLELATMIQKCVVFVSGQRPNAYRRSPTSSGGSLVRPNQP